MSLKFLSRLDPKNIVLQETGDKKTSWIQIFRKGSWKHPRYGDLKFTDEIFKGFIENFNANVRGIDLAIDCEHEPEKGACGWIKQLEQRGEGLWALVKWTSRGLQLIADGVFRYTSGDFDFLWKNEETGKKYKNVIFGAALTNRPFLKNMSPINLSEFREELEKDADIRSIFRIAEDLLKLKEGDAKMKTDVEIMAVKNEADLTPEELARKKELQKIEDEKAVTLAKKKLAERAKAVKLAEDATEDEVEKKEKEKKLQDDADALKKRAKAVGLPEDATEADILKKEKEKEEEAVQLKKKLAERAKKVGLSETATSAEVDVKEKEIAAAGGDVIGNMNEQKVKMTVALGLSQDSTLDQIYAAVNSFIQKAKAIEGSARTMSERAKAVGLSETATEKDVVAKEKELSEKKIKEEIDALLASDIPTFEKKLAEMRTSGADALTIKLLEDSISSKKKLREEQVKNAKEKIELKLKEHFRAGKLTAKERDTLKVILCNQVEMGETSFKLSEKDKDGKDVEATKTLNEVIDAMLSDRPAIIELQEIAKKELAEPPKGDAKTLKEGEAEEVGRRVAYKVTGSSKSAKQLAERAKEVGLPATATLAEVEAEEGKK